MGLNAGNIVRMEFKVRNISTVEGRHQRRFDVGMPETQAVTELVGSYLEQIDSWKQNINSSIRFKLLKKSLE